MSVKTLIVEEIQDEIKELNKMEVGSDTYKTTVDGVTKLADRFIEIEKLEIDREFKASNQSIDEGLKLAEMENEKKDRLIKNCLTGLSIITGVGLTVWGTVKSLKFEEEGTVTTIVGRGFINKLLPKK